MRKLNLVVSFLLIVLAFTAEAKLPPPGTGKADVPANILIMLDVSGSMLSIVNPNSRIYKPQDVAVDSQGNIFIVERDKHRIKKFNSAGNLLEIFGEYGGSNGRFRYPEKIAI